MDSRKGLPPRDKRGRFVKRHPLPPAVVARLEMHFIPLVTHERNAIELAPPPMVLDLYAIRLKEG